MRKTLAVVVVFGVALLVAPPAQAEPVKQRATLAALCYEAYRLVNGSDITESEIQEIFGLTPSKCLTIIIRHYDWLEAQYPSQFQSDTYSERTKRADLDHLLGRCKRAYGVTQTQISNAYKRLGYS